MLFASDIKLSCVYFINRMYPLTVLQALSLFVCKMQCYLRCFSFNLIVFFGIYVFSYCALSFLCKCECVCERASMVDICYDMIVCSDCNNG